MSAPNLPAAAPTHPEPAPPVSARFQSEQKQLGADCDFPDCDRHAELGARMCDHHELVRLSSNGSWVDDRHRDGGHG